MRSLAACSAMTISRSFGNNFGTDSDRVEQLQATNAGVKSRGVSGRVIIVRDSLFLRGTLTPTDGSRKDRKICLDLPAAQGDCCQWKQGAATGQDHQQNGHRSTLTALGCTRDRDVEKANSITLARAVGGRNRLMPGAATLIHGCHGSHC